MLTSLTPAEIQYYKAHASDNLQPNMIAANICGLILPFTAVALRFIARRNSAAVVGADDWLVLGALVPLTAYAITAFLSVHNGAGRHVIFVKSLESYVQTYIAQIKSYAACVILTKFSILYFYRRLFPSKWLLRVSWAIEFLVVAYNGALVLIIVLECIPVSSLWTTESATCIKIQTPSTILAVVNVATDIFILTLPIKFVWHLCMPAGRKLQVCGIFLLGSVACIFGILRAVYVATADPVDQSYYQVASGLWSHAEMTVGVIAACLPTFGIFFTKTSLIPAIGRSIAHMTSNIWGRWICWMATFNHKTANGSLPSRRNYEVYSDVNSSGMRDTADKTRSYGSLSMATTARSPEHGGGKGQFATLENLDGILCQSTFSVASEIHQSAPEL